MPDWRRLIAFQVSSFVLFSYLPPPFDVIGITPFFIALGFYKAAVLVFSICMIKLSIFAPYMFDILNSAFYNMYYAPYLAGPYGILNDLLLLPETSVLYCYQSQFNVWFNYQQFQIFAIIFMGLIMFGPVYFEIRIVQKYIKPRVDFLIG